MVKRHAVGKVNTVYLPARLEMVGNGDLVVSILATQDEIVAFATDVKIAAVHVAEINTVMPSRSGIVVVDDVITVSACEMVDVITAPTIQNIISFITVQIIMKIASSNCIIAAITMNYHIHSRQSSF